VSRDHGRRAQLLPVRLKGETEWKSYGAGESFQVPGNSSFDIEVADEAYHYVCHFA
jgi:uncharacterized protein YaiE (UPF0345 family)